MVRRIYNGHYSFKDSFAFDHDLASMHSYSQLCTHNHSTHMLALGHFESCLKKGKANNLPFFVERKRKNNHFANKTR